MKDRLLKGHPNLLLVAMVVIATFSGQMTTADAQRLQVVGTELRYGGRPVYLYGQGFWQAVVKGGFDVKAEARWYQPYRANLTRIKLVTTRVLPSSQYTPENPWYLRNDGKYDLSRWNPVFWQRLDDFLKENLAQKRFVILQLFDEVTMKSGRDQWDRHPLNPRHNVNGLGIPYGNTQGMPEVYDTNNVRVMDVHRKLVEEVLLRTSQYGHIIYEVCNEYGGTKDFLRDVLGWISSYEQQNSLDLPVCNMPNTPALFAFEQTHPAIDLMDFWHTPASIRSLDAPQLYNVVTSLYASNAKPIIAGRIGPEPDKSQPSSWQRRIARQALWALYMGGARGATTKEDYSGIENGPPAYNEDDEWESVGFLGLQAVNDNLWHTGGLKPAQQYLNSSPYLSVWFAELGREFVGYVIGSGSGDVRLRNLPAGRYTLKLFDPETGNVTAASRFSTFDGTATIPIGSLGNRDDVAFTLTPELFDVTVRYERNGANYRSIIELQDAVAVGYSVKLNGIDVSRDILYLYGPEILPNGRIRLKTPWVQFPKGVFELDVTVHGPFSSDRSVNRMRVE